MFAQNMNNDTDDDTLFQRELYIPPLAMKFLLQRIGCHFIF